MRFAVLEFPSLKIMEAILVFEPRVKVEVPLSVAEFAAMVVAPEIDPTFVMPLLVRFNPPEVMVSALLTVRDATVVVESVTDK